MSKIITTNHKVINVFGIKICDIWEDYIERRLIKYDLQISDFNIEEKEDDNWTSININKKMRFY